MKDLGRWRPRATLALPIVFVLILPGCDSNQLKVALVSGVVTLDGQPLTRGTVLFTPPAGKAAKGMIAADGTFTLSTYKDGDGAIVGLHKVAVFARGGLEQPLNRPIDANPAAIQPTGVPRIYRNPDRSGLTFEVKSDEQNHFELKLVRNFMPTS